MSRTCSSGSGLPVRSAFSESPWVPCIGADYRTWCNLGYLEVTRMRRLTSVAIVLFVCAVVGLAAQESKDAKKCGTALTLTEVTKISDIYANPDKFAGKRVQVEGPVVDV